MGRNGSVGQSSELRGGISSTSISTCILLICAFLAPGWWSREWWNGLLAPSSVTARSCRALSCLGTAQEIEAGKRLDLRLVDAGLLAKGERLERPTPRHPRLMKAIGKAALALRREEPR